MTGTDQRFKDGWDTFMLALQEDDPTALRSQYLHNRANVGDELKKRADFWSQHTAAAASVA